MRVRFLCQRLTVVLAFLFIRSSLGQSGATNVPPNVINVLLTVEGKVEEMRSSKSDWSPAAAGEVFKAKDRLRTLFKSRGTFRLSDQSVLRIAPLTTLEVQNPAEENKRSILDLKAGAAYFYNREGPGETEFRTPVASGAVRGTEFHLAVAEDGSTVVTLIDGAVELTNSLGQVSLTSGEQGIVAPGKPPRKTAVINAINIIQWALYYPAILDVSELGLGPDATQGFGASLDAYQTGELLKANSDYPTNRTSGSAGETIYNAALLLSVGEVEKSQALLKAIANPDDRFRRLAEALQQLISAVKFETSARTNSPELATEWMAESYYQQSRSHLEPAREAARQATIKSPNFGFAWARLAELEFSFGRTDAALAALEKAIRLTPRNAQALSLRGFLYAAQNRMSAAVESFDEAIAVDGGLANAWLGRGLSKIRQGIDFAHLKGQSQEGRQDLQTAATLEPNRAVLRSYLGKAFSNEGGKSALAMKELKLAKKLDPNDPTSWLYSALLNQQNNRVNEAVEDLEKSKELNDNRRVFRSKLLLDQDRAVRGANLAAVYRDDGMTDFSVREASRAVNSDYGNFSAHQFLASSYDALRDPKQVNLRYETPWLSELLLANLLAPVGGGPLSQNISQQEYSKLFERDRIGVSSGTEYFSTGAWNEYGSQFGTIDNTSYAIDAEYRSDPGHRPNNDFNTLTLTAKFKQQITPKDSIFFEAIYFDYSSGDVAQYYDQTSASQTQRVKEKQEPVVFAGYHHEWSPGNHTLFLVGRLNDTFTLTDPANVGEVFARGQNRGVREFGLNFRSVLEGYSAEAQQILTLKNHTIVGGARFQTASSDTAAQLDLTPNNPAFPNFSQPAAKQDIVTDLNRISLYAYDQWQVFDPLLLSFGLSYDQLHYPVNGDVAPITSAEANKSQVSPKAGFVWTVVKDTHLRGAFTRSLGGVFFDNSIRLEPTQVAGFNQAFRSMIPESIIGLVPGSRFETFDLGLDHRFETRTYVGLTAEYLDSTATRTVGAFEFTGFLNPPFPSGYSEQVPFTEKSLIADVNQLIGQEWSIGARYRVTRADLAEHFGSPFINSVTRDRSTLHQLNAYAIYNLPCGFFSEFNSIWNLQSTVNDAADMPGDNFWQFNFFVGYRFPRRLAEVRLGVLNMTDRDYRLNPLTIYNELPRERTFMASLKFNF